METIAITDWGNLVSPLYDAACYFRIIRSDGASARINVKNASLPEKADICRRKGVSVLICGAISTIAEMLLRERNINVVSWISGPVDKVVAAYRDNLDVTVTFSMPGRCRGGGAGKPDGRCCRRGRATHYSGGRNVQE